MDGSGGDERVHPSDLKSIKLPLNVSQKFTLLNTKTILIIIIFRLFYINLLMMSDSFSDVMSSV